jgi:DNA polymerase-3 subunit gamma/tau
MKDLATIYRPLAWDQIFGQDKIVEILQKQALSHSGLSNAYIFSGKSGIGKTTLARLFFRALNCDNPDKYANPCLKCDRCANFKYELREINASDTRSIDDMRDITRDMSYVPAGKYNGILLDEVHMLLRPAWNCLLKPIEESAKSSIWLLCTTELSKIPKTIQTRCQIFKLNPLRWSDIFKRLQQIVDDVKMSISEDELWIIARNSDNNLRQAIHLLEQYSVIGDVEKIIKEEVNIDFLTALSNDDYKSIFKVFNNWQDKYADIDAFLNALKWDLSICLRIKLNIPNTDINQYKLDTYNKISIKLTEQKIMNMLQILLEIQEKISGIWDYNSLFLNGLCKFKNNLK